MLLLQGLRQQGVEVGVLARAGGEFARAAEQEGFEVGPFEGNGRSPWQVWHSRRWLAPTFGSSARS